MLVSKSTTDKSSVILSTYNWDLGFNNNIYVRLWRAEPEPKALLIVSHSICEHSGRYEELALYLAEKNIAVLAFDMPGYGKSYGQQGFVSSYYKMLDILKELIIKAQELFVDVPLVLYGHGFGATLVNNFAKNNNNTAQAIIISSPIFNFDHLLKPWKIIAAKLLGLILPFIKVTIDIKVESITGNLKSLHNFKSDPLIHNIITLGFIRGAMAESLSAASCWYRINKPVLVLHGAEDTITSSQQTKLLIMNAGEKTTYHEIASAYHELHNDLGRAKTFELIYNWLEKELKIV